MQVPVKNITAMQFIRSLTALKGVLSKASAYADAKKFDLSVLFKTRLFPDQFALDKQIQIACDTAKFCVARLTGLEPPSFEDNEAELEQFLQRIDGTIAYLETASAESFNGYEDRKIAFYWYPGHYLTGQAYLEQYAIPNFYFHLTTAYAILRASGVELGKADYMGELDWQQEV